MEQLREDNPAIHPPDLDTRSAARQITALFVAAGLLVAFLTVLVKTAWISDDAYITLRVLDNFIHGHGLRWNTLDRVWVATNPFWMFAFAPLYAAVREGFFSIIFFGMAVSSLVFWFTVARPGGGTLRVALAGLLLIGSKSFVDFSTSGLENPLSHLLLVIFFILFFSGEASGRRRPGLLALLVALAILNRPDALLLYLSALAWVAWRERSWRAARAMALGFAPLLAWELFALLYYGFPFPNTAYAKLTSQFGHSAILQQGFNYYLSSLAWDPLTLATIAAGVVLAFLSRRRAFALLAAGILVHLLYVLWIGGDFMNGRFFTAPFLGAVLIVGCWPHRISPFFEGMGCVAVLAAAFLLPGSHLLPDPKFGQPPYHGIDVRGVADERRFYYADTGLLRAGGGKPMPTGKLANDGRAVRQLTAGGRKQIAFCQMAGIYGFTGGPNLHVIDPVGLGDAFLVRMPPRYARFFRPGHLKHIVPFEYADSIRAGRPLFRDPATTRLYEAIRLITQGPIFRFDRLREIVRINTGGYRDIYRRIAAHYGDGATNIFHGDVARPPDEGTSWNNLDLVGLERGPVTVLFDILQKGTRLATSLYSGNTYQFTFLRGEREVFEKRVFAPEPSPAGGLKYVMIDLPPPLKTEGFDRVRVAPVEGNGHYALGHVRVLSD